MAQHPAEAALHAAADHMGTPQQQTYMSREFDEYERAVHDCFENEAVRPESS